MTNRFLLFATSATFVLFASSSGCMGDEFPQIDPDTGDDDDDNNDDNNNDDNNDDDDKFLILTSSHDGWREPNCWHSGCHDSDSHNSGLDPYQCVECHGNNGTKSEHKAGQNCSQCHNNPSDHPDDSFPDNSCVKCHD